MLHNTDTTAPTLTHLLAATVILLLAGLLATAPAQAQAPFITTWKTDNPGPSNDDQITIPTASFVTYDYTVDWGDGTSDTGVTGGITHTYAATGTYTVEITGDFPRIFFFNDGNPSDAEKILSVEQWGDIAWSSMGGAFNGTSNLVISATDAPDLTSVTSTGGMFTLATSMNSDLSGWDVSNVENMASMFSGASAFNGDISSWDVSNVTDMRGMFGGAAAFNGDISGWDVSNVTNMGGMFDFALAFNHDLGGWDIGNVTTMAATFNSSGLSTANYDATLIGWAGQAVQAGVELGADNLEYCLGADARQSLIDDDGWTITGDTEVSCADPENVAGWRLITVPGADLTVQDLADRNLVQGISDSYPGAAANLFTSYEGPTNADYTAAASTSETLDPGRGFFWYLFDDADFTGTPPPEFVDVEAFSFPETLGTAQTSDVNVAFGAIPDTDGGDLPAYMIGNPFRDAFQLAGISVDDGTLQSNFFAWDPAAASYVTLGTSDYVSAWQGLWAEVDGGTTAPTFTLAFASVDDTQDPPFIGLRSGESYALDIDLRGTLEGGQPVADLANRVRFEPDAMLTWDRHDGSKFYPPISTDDYALLSLEGIREGDTYRQAVRSLPSGLDEVVMIPVSLLSGEAGDFTLSAEALNLPEGWSATLRDLATGTETNLLEESYAFSGAAGEEWQDRFEITITPAGVINKEGEPMELRLSDPAPNPAMRSTALVLRAPEAQQVTVRVFDALGRRVATTFDGSLAAGEETRLSIDTSNLAAGAYVVRVEGETFSETRRFAVVR